MKKDSPINYLSYHIEKLEKEKQIILAASKKSKIIKIEEVSELESRKSTKKMKNQADPLKR